MTSVEHDIDIDINDNHRNNKKIDVEKDEDDASAQRRRLQRQQRRRDWKLLHSIEHKEEIAREGAISNPWYLLYLRGLAAVRIMVIYLISWESLLGMLATIASTVYFCWKQNLFSWQQGYGTLSRSSSTVWNGEMSFVLVTFAVASPIIYSVRMAFTRRERALERIGDVRANLHAIYLAHALWDWPQTGGRKDVVAAAHAAAAAAKATTGSQTPPSPRVGGVDEYYLSHADAVLAQLIGIGDELARFLTLPNISMAWSRATLAGRKEASQTVQAAYSLLESVTVHRMTKLTVLAEKLKSYGLIGSETARCRDFERTLLARVEQLRLLKLYRTPQALWSFARIFTLCLPPFYGQTFAHVASESHSITVGILFGVFTSLVVTALLEAVQILEDPFTAFVSLDGIDVREEFEVLNWNQLMKTRALLFPTAPEYPLRARPALTGRRYDPDVHYHATPEERQAILQAERNATYKIITGDVQAGEVDNINDKAGDDNRDGTKDGVDDDSKSSEETHSVVHDRPSNIRDSAPKSTSAGPTLMSPYRPIPSLGSPTRPPPPTLSPLLHLKASVGPPMVTSSPRATTTDDGRGASGALPKQQLGQSNTSPIPPPPMTTTGTLTRRNTSSAGGADPQQQQPHRQSGSVVDHSDDLAPIKRKSSWTLPGDKR